MKRFLSLFVVAALFVPIVVSAAVGLASPFGGRIANTFYCSCSQTWLLTIQRGSSIIMLDYVPGTQGFRSYNMPMATNVLGMYSNSAPACYIYIGTGCSPVNSSGLITYTVGSSPR